MTPIQEIKEFDNTCYLFKTIPATKSVMQWSTMSSYKKQNYIQQITESFSKFDKIC